MTIEHVWVENEDVPLGLLACSCGVVAVYSDDAECPVGASEWRIAAAIQAAADTRGRGVYNTPVSQSLEEIAERLTGEWEEKRKAAYESFYGKGSWDKLPESDRDWRA